MLRLTSVGAVLPAAGTVHTSTLVLHASSRVGSLAVNATSRPSGLTAYPSLPPNGPGGTSYGAPANRCCRVPSSHAFQWR